MQTTYFGRLNSITSQAGYTGGYTSVQLSIGTATPPGVDWYHVLYWSLGPSPCLATFSSVFVSSATDCLGNPGYSVAEIAAVSYVPLNLLIVAKPLAGAAGDVSGFASAGAMSNWTVAAQAALGWSGGFAFWTWSSADDAKQTLDAVYPPGRAAPAIAPFAACTSASTSFSASQTPTISFTRSPATLSQSASQAASPASATQTPTQSQAVAASSSSPASLALPLPTVLGVAIGGGVGLLLLVAVVVVACGAVRRRRRRREQEQASEAAKAGAAVEGAAPPPSNQGQMTPRDAKTVTRAGSSRSIIPLTPFPDALAGGHTPSRMRGMGAGTPVQHHGNSGGWIAGPTTARLPRTPAPLPPHLLTRAATASGHLLHAPALYRGAGGGVAGSGPGLPGGAWETPRGAPPMGSARAAAAVPGALAAHHLHRRPPVRAATLPVLPLGFAMQHQQPQPPSYDDPQPPSYGDAPLPLGTTPGPRRSLPAAAAAVAPGGAGTGPMARAPPRYTPAAAGRRGGGPGTTPGAAGSAALRRAPSAQSYRDALYE